MRAARYGEVGAGGPRGVMTGCDPNDFRAGFVDGARLEILGAHAERYHVRFEDAATGEVVHAGTIANNHWIRTARQYFTRWRIVVRRERDGATVFSHHYACRGRRVYVALESRALGDTLAWFPAVDAFRRRHRCRMVCSTFHNELFRDTHPAIEFVEPGTTVHDLYAMYRIGWFHGDDGRLDGDRHPGDVRVRPLAQTAYDILGLPYRETRPRLRRTGLSRPIAEPYVCIGVHATAQAKYWNNPHGWPEVVRFLRDRGHRVVLLSREGREHMGNRVPDGVDVLPPGPLAEVIRWLEHAALFVGVGSGLAWLAWAVGCPTCVVSGFSLPFSEMEDCIRVAPRAPVCTGCYNRYRLDAGDWLWCPDRRDTPRRFECTRAIAAAQVIDAIRDRL